MNEAQTNRIQPIEKLKYIRFKCIRNKFEHLRKSYIRIK